MLHLFTLRVILLRRAPLKRMQIELTEELDIFRAHGTFETRHEFFYTAAIFKNIYSPRSNNGRVTFVNVSPIDQLDAQWRGVLVVDDSCQSGYLRESDSSRDTLRVLSYDATFSIVDEVTMR